MANKIISIEVGYSLTKICEMDFRAKNPKVYKYFSIPTPEGVFDDGFLSDNPAFVASIKQSLSFNKIRTKQAVCTITSSKIATREVMLPSVKASQVQALVEANANDYFPIDLQDYEIGHLVIGNIKETDGSNKMKVLVMACSKQLIQGYDKLCEQLGLHLISIDYSGNSIYQIMKNEIKDDTEMVLRVDEKQSVATIISNQNMMMQRNIVYGIESAIYMLMSSTAFVQNTYEEALEELKRIRCIKLVLNENTKIIDKDDEDIQVTEKVSKAMTDITESLAPLVGNIARVIDLYNSKSPDKPIKKIQLIGLGADLSGLSKLLTNELGVKTVVCNNIKSIGWNHSAGDGSSGRYVSTIGAGIAPVGFINEEKRKNDIKDVNYKSVSILTAILGLTVCAALLFVSYSSYYEQNLKQKRLRKEEALYLEAEKAFNEAESLKELSLQVDAAGMVTTGPNDNLVDFLTELETVLPEESLVLYLQSDTLAANVTLRVLDLETVAKVIENIRDFECAHTVTVLSIEEKVPTDDDVKNYVLDHGYMTEEEYDKLIEELDKKAQEENLTDEEKAKQRVFLDKDGTPYYIPDKYYDFNFTVAYKNYGIDAEDLIDMDKEGES